MKDDITKRMWAIFDKTGVSLSLCNHGFALVSPTWSRVGSCESLFNLFLFIPDLCPSRAKYPLAMVEKMLDVFAAILVVVLTLGVGLRQCSTTAHWALVLVHSTTQHW